MRIQESGHLRTTDVLTQASGPPSKWVNLILDLVLDTYTHEVWRGERHIFLSSKEYTLLELLMTYQGQVLSRTTIAERVWNEEAHTLSNIVDVYIRYLRNKLCANGEPNVIQTIRGLGYQLRATPSSS